jgi:hypothetical protein
VKRRHLAVMAIGSASLVVAGVTLAAQDRYALTAPSGIAFSEFKGYELWQMVGASQADDGSGCGTSPDPGCIKVILGNPAMMKGYAERVPDNGKPVADGAVLTKIEWAKASNAEAGYGMTVPGKLAEVAFMVKDARRFPDTDGWGYASFTYDADSDAWKAKGDAPDFVQACHGCHTIVKARDFVFTHYPKR